MDLILFEDWRKIAYVVTHLETKKGAENSWDILKKIEWIGRDINFNGNDEKLKECIKDIFVENYLLKAEYIKGGKVLCKNSLRRDTDEEKVLFRVFEINRNKMGKGKFTKYGTDFTGEKKNDWEEGITLMLSKAYFPGGEVKNKIIISLFDRENQSIWFKENSGKKREGRVKYVGNFVYLINFGEGDAKVFEAYSKRFLKIRKEAERDFEVAV
jgi:flagellar hook assembly protein FlgD